MASQPLPGGDALQIRALDLDRDIATLHGWFTQPHGRFWGLTRKSVDEVRAIYANTVQRHGHEVLIGQLASSGDTVCLFEAYDPAQDELGRAYRTQPGDRGLHLFIAPASHGAGNAGGASGFSYHLLRAMCAHLFAQPTVQRVVAEPDVLNTKVFARFRQAGFTLGPVVHLRYKTGQLVFLTRAQHQALDGQATPPKQDYPLRAPLARVHALIGRVRRRLSPPDSD